MKPHILVVDDDEMVLTGLAENLQEAGFKVSTASSGKQALQTMEAGTIHLVLSDLVMGGLDGLTLIRRLRERHPAVPVIVLTGHGSADSAVEALQLGAADYLQKPIAPKDIAQRIHTVLDAARMQRKLTKERRRHAAEQRRDDLRAQREDREATIDNLTAGVARMLDGFLDPVRRIAESGEYSQRYLEAVDTCVEQIEGFIADIRPAPRMESARFETLNMNEMLTAFLSAPEGRALCESRPDIRLHTKLADPLPLIAGSPSRIVQSLADLLRHVYACMPEGGDIEIQTYSLRDHVVPGRGAGKGDFAVCRIRDTDTVLTDTDREHLFDPFYVPGFQQGQRTGDCRLGRLWRNVREHGGFIEVKAGEERGTEYQLYWPGHEPRIAAVSSDEAPGQREILIVDDHPGHRDEALHLLESMGYEVRAVGSSEAALEFFSRRTDGKPPGIDLVLIDLVLGSSMDGLDTFRRIREIIPGQRAVLMSGFADTSRITEAKKAGIEGHLQKPLSVDQLARMLKRVLGD